MALRFSILRFLQVLLVFSQINLYAQSVSNYEVSLTGSSYTNINGILPALLGSGNDVTVPNIPIVFDFWYMGQKYTHVSASMYGWFTFGSSITTSNVNNLTGGGTRPVIAPLWDNIRINPGLVNALGIRLGAGTFNYSTSGTVGSRKFILQWHLVDWDVNASSSLLSSGVISFQAVLYETTGNIEFIYNPNSNPVNTGSASVGITALETGAGNFLSVNSISASPLTTSTTEEANSINAKPSGSRGILFNPQETNAPSNLTFSAVGTTGMKLNWMDNSSDEAGFVVYRSTNNTNFTYVATTAANAVSYNDTGLTAGTTYYYRVYALRENLSTAAAGSQATLTNCIAFNLLQVSSSNIIANYRLNGNANDFFGLNNGVLRNSPTSTEDRFGVPTGAYAFNGSNQFISTTASYNNPVNFTTSVWFKTSTTTGGLLLGFSRSQIGNDAHDRHLYMGVNGRLYFGVFGAGGMKTLVSSPETKTYNDGNWHMATATQSTTAGISLYIDGQLVGTDPTATTAENYTSGYWRMAGLSFNQGWPSAPTTYFAGALDDAFIFNRVLSQAEIQQLYTAPYGLQNNGPMCVGANLNLIAPTIPDATYTWTGPNGFTSNLQNPSVVYNLLRAGTYTLAVSRNGCTDVAYTKVLSDGRPGLWEGGSSTNWNLANNWCDGLLPQATTDVTIPSGKPRYPLVSSAAASVNNLSISNSATLTVDNQNLTIRGAINNSGIFNVANGSITFSNTTSAQVIPANVFQGNVIKNLTVANTFGLTLNGALRVNGTLRVTSGFFNANNDFLTLGASATSSAIVSPLTSSAYITGRVKVETFVAGGPIDPFRTYRMLSSPVYDNNESLVLTNVEGNRSAKFSQLIDDMILNGSTGLAGGFDATPVNQASAWTYNGGYIPVTNINTPVNAGQGMYIFFRGDRSNFTGKTIPPFAPVENTIVDYDGFLNQRDITVSLSHVTNGRFNLLGNPYASPIDWDSGSFTKTNLNNAIWVWKPSSRSYATYISGIGQNGGSRYIASGQSFFVRSSGASPSITFRESVKSTFPNTGMQLLSPGKMMAASSRTHQLLNYREEMGSTPVELSILRVGVKSVASFGEDEAVIVFKEGADAQWTDEDAVHFDGEQINLSSLSPNGRKLA